MIWYVLYKIPDRYGLISKRGAKEQIRMNSHRNKESNISLPTEGGEKSAVQTFLDIHKEDEALIHLGSGSP